ncbi:ABC transporter permease [Microbacterium mangrovi]|nr:ABC transporter permease [Microbacterium mangrovi]
MVEALMTRAILTRVLSAAVIILVVSAIVFFGLVALPGDAAQAILGRQATPELLSQFRAEHGLDVPAIQRYFEWLGGLFHGDLGTSLVSGQPIGQQLSGRVMYTVALAAAASLVLIPVSLVLGLWSATRATKATDNVISGSTLVFLSIPEFVIGALVIALFAVTWPLLPANSLFDSTVPIFAQYQYLILPTLTLVLAASAQATRMIRATMIDVLRSDYIQIAELKGVPQRQILFRHALPNALGPTLQIFAFTIAWLVGGVVTVEVVFSYPGLGSALVDAVHNRDFPVVLAIVMLATAAYVVLIMLADIAAMVLNPRLRKAA